MDIKNFFGVGEMLSRGKLSNKMVMVTTIMAVFLLVVMVVSLVYNSKQSVEATIGEHTVSIANNMLQFIDVEKIETFVNNPEENDLYWELREQLNDLREKNGVLFTYTYFLPEADGETHFLIDGMPLDDQENTAAIGEVTTSFTPKEVSKAVNGENVYTGLTKTKYGAFIAGLVPIKNNDGEVIALLGVDIDASQVESIVSHVAKDGLPFIIIICIIGSLVGLISIAIYVNRALKPISIIQQATNQLAEGDILQAKELVDSVNIKGNNEITAFVQDYNKAMQKLSTTFAAIQDKSLNLDHVVKQISMTADEVTSSNNKITQSMTTMSESALLQKTSNEEVVIAMNEMAIGIQNIADSTTDLSNSSLDMSVLVQHSATDAHTVVAQIQQVEASVMTTADYVQQMAEQFNEIENMVKIITNIADQTNLLALNAAIEAARAGEAGKGFAVVADEVKNLAELSRHSADDITKYLQSFLQLTEQALSEMDKSAIEVQQGSKAVMAIGEKLTLINQSFENVNDMIQSESAIIQQMSAGSEEVLASAEAMNRLVETTTHQAEEVNITSKSQLEIVDMLSNVVKQLDETSTNVIKEIEQFKI